MSVPLLGRGRSLMVWVLVAMLTLLVPGLVIDPVQAAPAVEEQDVPSPLPFQGPRAPWTRRKHVKERHKISAHGLIDLRRWPPEPPSPEPIDEQKLGRALKALCGGWMPPRRPFSYARWIIKYGTLWQVDPFLLAAVIYRHSRCLPQEETSFGIGLTKIDPRMHAPFIKRRHYHYWILEQGTWREKQLDLSRFAFVPGNLKRSEPNIYFAAALLALAKDQCPKNDGAFGSVPHRHFVSHFIWGDRVLGSKAEERVFIARRRLLEYYRGDTPQPRGRFKELALRCPLDGAPRVVSSVMGADRENGQRFHKGIDFCSTYGEPVRAVADGQVVLAGIDRPQGGPRNMAPEAALAVRRSELGPGGMFVMILHEGGLRSAYMHLARYSVQAGQRVTQGTIIGEVGKSGVKESGAHLHFELRFDGRHMDPMPVFAPYVIHPQETYLGRFVRAEEKRQRRLRRIRRFRALKAARQAQ